MPLINVRLSNHQIDDEGNFLKSLSALISSLTGKPEAYVMVSIQSDTKMMFAGIEGKCCFVEVKSIGSLNPPAMSSQICSLINEMTGINKDRIYISFADIPAKDWGFNGSTFG